MSEADNAQPNGAQSSQQQSSHPPAEAQTNQQQWHRVHFLTPILEFWVDSIGCRNTLSMEV